MAKRNYELWGQVDEKRGDGKGRGEKEKREGKTGRQSERNYIETKWFRTRMKGVGRGR